MSHWHKLGFQAFLAKEIMRKDTLPFAIGMGFVALMGLGLNASITEEDRKSSCLLYTSPSPRDGLLSRMPSSA